MAILNAAVRFLRSLMGGRRRQVQSEPSIDLLQQKIQYQFVDAAMLRQALTHKSSIDPGTSDWLQSNERLEFLGDAVLNCLVTEHLYKKYPSLSEGQLSKIKSLIVSRKILGELAYSMGVGPHMVLGISELKTGGQTRKSVLSNAFEAILGSLYLDGGIAVARTFLETHLFCRIEEFVNDEDNVNYKSKILELAQRDGFGAPRYSVVSTTGPDHAKEFHVRIDIAGVALGEGRGSNKKRAQQQAAYNATLNYSREQVLSRRKGANENEVVSH